MKKKISIQNCILWVGIFFLFSSCASYQSKISQSRELLKQGKFEDALPKLKELAEKPGDDQLVFLMEYGTALQMAGQYKESNAIFLRADKLSEQVDYHSVSNIALATVGSESMIQYKGDSYEKLFINISLAVNFIMLGQFDDAMVEARRITEKVNKFRLDGRQDYEQNPFANYLAAMLWEADQKYDDAYISYEAAYKLDGTNPSLPGDLIRAAKKARRDEAYKKWKKEFPNVKEDADWYDKSKGQIVVLIEQGWGPRKRPSPGEHRFPKLYPLASNTQGVKVEVRAENETAGNPLEQGDSRMVYDVEKVAIQTLDADIGWLVARRVGALAGKAVLADQIRQKNELLGMIAWIGMNLSDQADLRQWSTLPQTIQIARFWVKPGTYRLNMKGLTGPGAVTGEQKDGVMVQVKPGRSSFTFWRPVQ